jgi:hypothetical protein
MEKISKAIALTLTLTILLSCLPSLTVKPALANPISYTPPKPSIPEFTLNYTDNSYEVADNFFQNKSIEAVIKNQPSFEVICYNINSKNHSSENWSSYDYYSYESYVEEPYPYNGSNYTGGRLVASNSDFTVFVFGFEGNNGSDTYNLWLGNVHDGDQIDFQVQAYTAFWAPTKEVNGLTGSNVEYNFLSVDSIGDWSSLQTITVPEASASTSPTPTPTVPELPWLVILPLLLSVFCVAGIIRYRKTSSLSR